MDQISTDSLDQMAHPIHLHGHYFRVLGGLANSTYPANMTVAEVLKKMPDSDIGQALDLTSRSPRRDSVHLPSGGWLAIRFVADNPGAWLLHCHINSHLAVSLYTAERLYHVMCLTKFLAVGHGNRLHGTGKPITLV
jgi:FtsP/CotA-like multicopper oxidase with cupredoxin domain